MSRKKVRKTTKKTQNPQHSTIDQHYRQGKKLIPPLANIPKMQPSSWREERMPEMLWAVLLVSQLPRSQALGVFREVAKGIHKYQSLETPPFDITLSGLSKLRPEVATEILQIITSTEERKIALRPLLLFKDLPVGDLWEKMLDRPPQEDDWKTLMIAIAKTLDHQSQESTDCRWARLISYLAAGKLKIPEESAKEFVYYPDYGDMRKVRPSIRATEIAIYALEGEFEKGWCYKFWSQCLSDTDCFPLSTTLPAFTPVVGTTPQRVRDVYDHLLEHWERTLFTTAIDPKHDAVFGFAFYCLSMLLELLRIGSSQLITSRLALRTIVECYITLAYLAKKNDPEIWKSYRVFGVGQAKLQYLKLEELEVNSTYVDVETLKALANEDIWEEYLVIDLGHWEKSNLRDMSIDAGVKDIYDHYYSWSSSFAHGHWGSIRDVVFNTCGNPLHRLHRIPRKYARALPDVVPDACALTDKVLEILSVFFPEFPLRVTIV